HQGGLAGTLVADHGDVSDVLGLGRGHAQPFAVPVSPRTFSSVFATAGWIVQAALARAGEFGSPIGSARRPAPADRSGPPRRHSRARGVGGRSRRPPVCRRTRGG